MLLLMWMRCSYLIIELIRYFPFAFYLVLNFTCNMNKIKRVRWSHVYRTLDIDAPWFWKTDIKVTVLFLFERRICSIGNVNFFLFVTAVSVRIWVNYDAVLRYSYPPYAPLNNRCISALCNLVGRIYLMVTLKSNDHCISALCNLVGRIYLMVTLKSNNLCIFSF